MTVLIFLIACGAAAATGVIFQPGTWYDGLEKPFFTPPRWAFPVAWTSIYILIAIAGARLASLPGTGLLLALWAAQIALNTLWTPVFFGAHRIALGLAVIGVLWIVVATLTWLAYRTDTLSGALMTPYLLWLCVALALNFSIWRLNPAG